MTNPKAVIRTASRNGFVIFRSVYTFCSGCKTAHPFRIELFPECPLRRDGTAEPIWDWDGNLESPTFNPSMLAYGSVHLCPSSYVHTVVCDDPQNCGNRSHLVISEEPRVLGHNKEHIVNPAWGNCHSFLQNGRWQFLNDSAHSLAGKTVDMVPLPDWLVK